MPATSHIADNRQVTTGNTAMTEFYQIAGKAAQPGWDMDEKKSIGSMPKWGIRWVTSTGWPLT